MGEHALEKLIKETVNEAISSFVSNEPQLAKSFFEILEEENKIALDRQIISEMPISQKDMGEKYAEVIGKVVDNLICICLYPNSNAILHWRERACGLCKRPVDLNISPLKKNNADFRYKCLTKGIILELDADFGAVENHFRSVIAYYSKRPNPNERLLPYKPFEDAYLENKERVKNGVITLTKYVAEQDYNGMIDYMEKF